ncbi:filamin-C-like protein [Dinothrombium tinctorium]|uniref:Filamin-C-like protein n=2 Tax=Dinothrombium tinctorium TaxID=1965070 RepID=A0A443QEV8_9ACAR|nr:filamin-C-like protein [Dinothrombium tinctorium]
MIKKIEVTGRGILIGKSYMQNDFWIDGRAANLAGAGLSRASSQLKINDMGDGTFKCVYKPTAAGQYIINVKVEGIHVPGSPFYVRIT